MNSRNILHHVITVKIIENTAALDTSRLSQAAFKNSYADYSAIARSLDDYDVHSSEELARRVYRVEDLVGIALKQRGLRVNDEETRIELINGRRLDMLVYIVLEESSDG